MSFSDGAALCDASRAGFGLAQLHGYYIDFGERPEWR
jgi:hypothetical protein